MSANKRNMYIKRSMEATILKVTAKVQVLLLTGPKQVGKTTLLLHCAGKNRRYVTLDDSNQRTLAKSNPKLFFEINPPPILIDEIHRVPELIEYISVLCVNECSPGLFWLAGLKEDKLIQRVTDVLTSSSVVILELLGLSQAEILHRAEDSQPILPTPEWLQNTRGYAKHNCSLNDVFQRIWNGSFPELAVNSAVDHEVFYASYVQRYIRYVHSEISEISNVKIFNNFLRVVAASTGHLLNYAILARDAGINLKITKDWLNILESSGIIYLLPQYHNSEDKNIIKTPKLYFLDTGLCVYLTRWQSAKKLATGAMSGHILETYVFTEILKRYLNNGKEVRFNFYRDQQDREVDLMLYQDDILYPIEMKKTIKPTIKCAVNFQYLAELKQRIGHGMVICLVEMNIPLSKEVDAVPVWYL